MSRAWPLVAAVLCACLLAGSARAQPASEAERDFYTDRALEALANGDLELAERVLAAAAALPGDPARRATVASLGARVHDLRLRRGETVVRQLPPAAAASQRAPLLSLTSLLGFGLYGWAVPLSLGIDSGESTRTFVGAYMVTASSSFVLPYLLTREAAVTPAQVNLAFYGGTRGGWHGVLVGALLAGDLSPEIRHKPGRPACSPAASPSWSPATRWRRSLPPRRAAHARWPRWATSACCSALAPGTSSASTRRRPPTRGRGRSPGPGWRERRWGSAAGTPWARTVT